MKFLQNIPSYLFFTGKGGVGKTSISCATAIRLAELGKRQYRPASNVGQVFDQTIGNTIQPVTAVSGLSALEISPQDAAPAISFRNVRKEQLPKRMVRKSLAKRGSVLSNLPTLKYRTPFNAMRASTFRS